jgi:Flp pilus assembly pilin Flp
MQRGNSQMLKLYNHHKRAITALEIRFLKQETGQTMVEYVMLIVLVALTVFLLTPNIKSAIVQVFSNTSSALQ